MAGYNVYRSSNGGTSYQALGSVAASQTSYIDNTVASGQAYDYIVKAYDSSHVESGRVEHDERDNPLEGPPAVAPSSPATAQIAGITTGTALMGSINALRGRKDRG